MKLGDAVSKVATPIAGALGLDCYDPETKDLRPESPCAQRRAAMNAWGDEMYDELFQPKKKGNNNAVASDINDSRS